MPRSAVAALMPGVLLVVQDLMKSGRDALFARGHQAIGGVKPPAGGVVHTPERLAGDLYQIGRAMPRLAEDAFGGGDAEPVEPSQILGRAGRADENRPRGGRLVAATIHRSPLGDAVTQDLNTLAQDYVRLWDVSAPAGIADRLYTSDVVDHNPLPGQGPGLGGIKQLVTVYHSVFPDLSVSTDDVVSSGDRVVVRWTGTGTHQGDQLGVPATGKQVRLTGIDILRIEDGRIVERWGETNGLEMMQQITSA